MSFSGLKILNDVQKDVLYKSFILFVVINKDLFQTPFPRQ